MNYDGTKGYSWNPVTGVCKKGCGYCYALDMGKRFHWETKIGIDMDEVKKPIERRKPSTIFVGSVIDLFHVDIPASYLDKILRTVRQCPQHTFIFLTKMPGNYMFYSFPQNCWLGATEDGAQGNLKDFRQIRYPNKFISFEPLIKRVDIDTIPDDVKLYIIGACTGKRKKLYPTDKEWARELISYGQKKGKMIFLKDNLGWNKKIQEIPWVGKKTKELF